MSDSASDEGSSRTYNGKRRREGEPDHLSGIGRMIQKWGPIIATIPAIGAAIFAVTNLYFQSDAEAADTKNMILMEQAALSREINKERERNNGQDLILNEINSKLDRGEVLALKAERRGLRAEIKSTNNPAVRSRLEDQLEEVEEDLRLKGVQ